MEKLKSVIQILNTQSVKYVIIRYLTYIIQFINAVLLLRYLGKYQYGIYSFIVLFFSYFIYVNLGINYSLNTLLSIYKNRTMFVQKLWSVCCTLNVILCVIVVLLNILIIIIYPTVFEKYEYLHYSVWILMIGLLINLNLSYVSIYRIYGDLWKINFQQFIPNLLLFIFILILQNRLTVNIILYLLVSAQFVALLIFIYKAPLFIKFSFNAKLAVVLLKRGIHLMLQSFSFNFITVAATTVVSVFYTAEDLGLYSLSNTIVNAIVLALGAFIFLLYPKILNRFANGSILEIELLLKKVRNIYILGADYIALLSLLCIPLVSFFIPQYSSMFECFKILTVSQMVFNSTMGYSQLLIAKKMEQKMTIYGLLSVCVVFGCSILIGFFKLSFYYISFAVLAGITLYSFLVLYIGISFLKKVTWENVFKELFSLSKIVSILIIFISFFMKENYITPVLSFLTMLFMTRYKILNMIKVSSNILLNKDLLKI